MHTPQPQSPSLPAGAQLVELEPVFVSTSRIGPMIAALRRHDIYFQFGPRRGHETILFVLPGDREGAQHLAETICGPLVGTGCHPKLQLAIGLVFILFAGLALMVSMIGL